MGEQAFYLVAFAQAQEYILSAEALYDTAFGQVTNILQWVCFKGQLVAMSLKDQITEEIKAAMKSRDKLRLEAVRSIKKALLEKEVSVRPTGRSELTEAEEIDVLAQQAKQRRDSIAQYRQAGRNDLADVEVQELAVIEAYLPKQLSEAEIEAVIDQVILQVGATSPKDMGKVMGPAMQQLKGKADGKKVQDLVKAKLRG